MKASTILIPLNIIIIVVCGIWFYEEPGFKPIISFLTTTAALIAQIFVQRKNKKNQLTRMTQSGGNNSKNYQAGGDININSGKND